MALKTKGLSGGKAKQTGLPAATAGLTTQSLPAPYNPYASPVYTGAQTLADKKYTSDLGAIEKRTTDTALDYGATLARDDKNNITGAKIDYTTIDTTNPFSKAALLKRSADQQRERSTNSYAARGALYSGSLLNARNQDQFGFESGQDQLSKQLAQVLSEAQIGKNEAAQNKDLSMYSALVQALQSAPSP